MTERGATVTADRVVIATNAYTGDLWPGLDRTVLTPNSYQVATERLSDNARKSILPFGQVSSDARKILLYFRLDHEGRLLMGGRGPFRVPKDESGWRHLEMLLERFFPQAKGARFEHHWCGRVAITPDFLPHLHEPAPGVLVDIGCMGRGIALQTALGQAMARYIGTGDAEALPLPLAPIRPLPFRSLHKFYLATAIAWYRFLDRLGTAHS
jgi:glycine/D-amino acid oxidase-like deaminating enzyme